MKSSKKDFVAESEELVEEAERLLLEVQETYASGLNPDTINALFRTFHTLKGVSGLFGFKELADFNHAFESLLDDIRLGKIEVTDDVVRFLFSNTDTLKKVIADIEHDKEHDLSGHLRDIETFRSALKESGSSSPVDVLLKQINESILRVLSEYEEHRLKTNIKEGKSIYLAKAVFSLGDFDKALNELIGRIKSAGEQISTLPTAADLPPDSIGFNILFGTTRPLEELREQLPVEIEELIGRKTETPSAKPQPQTQQPQQAPEVSLKSSTSYVRVDIEKLDKILSTISELALARSALNRIGAEMVDTYGRTTLVIDVMKISQTFERKIADLKDQVLEVRMIPIGQIFSRLSQIIRRYSKESGKPIDLSLFGEETEIDKFLAEEIVDPLMHIVRNCIDHGIESPEDRRMVGKKDSGSITLKAFQRGNHVVIEVKDDGAGIDAEKVRKTAAEKELVAPDTELSDREILEFIFAPGFSTKSMVSEISGRGVGMNVVKEKLTSLGGFVDLETEVGKGTTFTLTIPITLAILKALIVRVGSQRFAIPLTSIAETLYIESKDMQTIEGRVVYNLRGEMLPMVSLESLFEIERDAADLSFAVVVGYGDRRLGILVDELIGQHEVVIKSLGEYFKGLHGFAGAAEVGKYEVLLVIDVEYTIETSLSKQKVTGHV